MKTFRDKEGREWAITVDVNAIKRVMRAQFDCGGEPIKVNLLSIVDDSRELLKQLLDYPPLIADIAYVLCQPQCEEKKISDIDFGRAIDGGILEKALDCIIAETVDFFQEGRRDVLRVVLKSANKFAGQVQEIIAARLESGELEKALNATLEEELERFRSPSQRAKNGTGSVGNSPASSESMTPAPGPSPS